MELKYGVEIECYLKNSTPQQGENYNLTTDGSLRLGSFSNSGGQMMEIRVGPADYKMTVKTVKDLYKNYVKGVNDSCGLHIHISRPDNDLNAFCSFAFYKYFMKRIFELLPEHTEALKARMSNTHCRELSLDEMKSIMYDGVSSRFDRYKIINWHAYRRHGTVEFRIFPAMEKASGAVKCINTVTRIVNEWIEGEMYASTTKLVMGGMPQKSVVDVDFSGRNANAIRLSNLNKSHDYAVDCINAMFKNGRSINKLEAPDCIVNISHPAVSDFSAVKVNDTVLVGSAITMDYSEYNDNVMLLNRNEDDVKILVLTNVDGSIWNTSTGIFTGGIVQVLGYMDSYAVIKCLCGKKNTMNAVQVHVGWLVENSIMFEGVSDAPDVSGSVEHLKYSWGGNNIKVMDIEEVAVD
jgi:hypothetical protein